MISLPYKLKLFLEHYGYETNDIYSLTHFGISKNIKQNFKL